MPPRKLHAVPQLQAFVLTVLAPLTLLYKLEGQARSAFLVRLPLLPPERTRLPYQLAAQQAG